ncbi:Ig-like domain repeat protein [Terriglobus roseus]|uniref:NHL repeat-containing protein n=1 Tax=Terriglobus roseus TaxID=392734 RepID=A0A1H4U895_9BACT|nr:Ig-like domain repeat protein [Terriglobus roseus]SEC64935.1 NHL repeat-containing protein [Terriglobus roseus]
MRRFVCCVAFGSSLLPTGMPHAQTRLVLEPGNTLSTLAGNGQDSHTISGAAPEVALGAPRGLVYDGAGNLYLADSRNHQIDRITPAGALTVFAGTGMQGYRGDGGPAISAELNEPTALALASDGSLFLADSGNHCIRRIVNGTITTIAGNGTAGFSGDSGTATAAQLRSPGGLAFGEDGMLYVADTGNHRLRRVTSDGGISTVAGNGEEGDAGDGGSALSASFRSPGSLQMLPDGRLLIADMGARRIRLLTDGTIVAYTTAAKVRRPEGLGADISGSLLIADAGTQQVSLSGLDASGGSASTALVGNGIQGLASAGAATASAMDSPSAAVEDSNGNVVISDRRNHQVLRLALAALAFGDVPAGLSSAAQTLTLENESPTELTVAAVQLPSGFTIATSESTCGVAPFSLQPAGSCGIEIAFSPIAQGAQTAFLHLQLTGEPQANVRLTGNGTAPGSLAPSTTTLTSNGSISYAGSPVEFATNVSGTLGTIPKGSVTFFDGDVPLTTVALAVGSATLSTTAMQTGLHTLHVTYSGDSSYAASRSQSITQTVVPAPDFTISSASSYSAKAGGSLSIPLSILPVNGTLNHTLTLSVSGLPAGATATFMPSILTLGGDPANVSLAITIPISLAHKESSGSSIMLACCVAGIFLLGPLWRLRGRSHALHLITLILVGTVLSLAITGCGGFRVAAISSGTGTTTKTFHYTTIVTAVTTGVMGDALTHTATIDLVVTQ